MHPNHQRPADANPATHASGLRLNLFQRHSLKARITLFTLLMFVLAIWSLAFVVSHLLRQSMQKMIGDQLYTGVSVVAEAVNDEVTGRFAALTIVADELDAPMLAQPGALQQRLQQRPILQMLFNSGTFITDQQGTAVASLPVSANRVGVNYLDREHVALALKAGKSSLSQPLVSKKLNIPVFAMAVPIRDRQGNVVGVLVGVTDLRQPNFLDKVVQHPYGKTGGYVIAAPKPRLVVTATDKTRIMTAFPAPGVNPLFDRYLQGYEGTGRIVDSRGLEVLSAARQIAAADWLLIVRIPVAEAFAPIRDVEQRTLAVALLLTLLAGGLTWWMLRWQFAPMTAAVKALPALVDAQPAKQPLPILHRDEVGELIAGFNDLLEKLGHREEVLKESERLLKESQSIARLGSYAYDFRTGFWSSSDTLDALFGIDANYVRSLGGWLALIHPDDRAMMAAYLQDHVIDGQQTFDKVYRIIRHNDQGLRWVHGLGRLKLDSDGQAIELLGTIQDVSERHSIEEQVQSLAYSDPLTGLPNRRFLMDRIDKAMANGLRRHTLAALLMVDLDNFKTLNDTQGHHQGDLLLQEVARRLLGCVREVDTVARLGSDEFVVLLEDLSPSAAEAATQALHIGDKILAALEAPYLLGLASHQTTASIGITLFADSSEAVDDPLKRADLAMNQAKQAGRNVVRFFDPQMQVVVNARAALEIGLREALQLGQFELFYQPQVNLRGDPLGVEALLRWQHPTRGRVSPAAFIPIAEESGLIVPIGRWVLETACAQLAAWVAQPETAALSIAVNVSARQFYQPDFVDQVLGALARTGARAQRLKLELTESVLVSSIEDVIAKMGALKRHGVGFSLDDFGTGYSSLSYLKRLPLDQLKIDQGFVRDILNDPNDAAIAKMVIALADTLGLAVIAEGVETSAQRDFLAELGCHEYQGYLYSQPVPISALEIFLSATQNKDR